MKKEQIKKTIERIGQKLKEARKNLYYKANVRCENCGFIGEIEIHKGKLIDDGVEGAECPNCKCRGELEKWD